MLNFVILVLMAIAIETARRYFVVYRFCEENFKMAYLPTTIFIIAAMVAPAFFPLINGDKGEVSFVVVLTACVADFLVFSFVVNREYSQNKRSDDGTDDDVKGKRQFRAFMLSYLLPFVICIAGIVWSNHFYSKEFEEKWQQTEMENVVETPLRTIIKGNEKIVFQTKNRNIVIIINDDNVDLLNVQKGDIVRYLKVPYGERIEVVTKKGKVFRI